MWRSRCSAVTLAEVLELRGQAGLSDPELWALLCQATQALQDLFLSNGDHACPPPPRTAACRLLITSRGRVSLDLSPDEPAAAPDPPPPPPHTRGVAAADSLEKMWILSLGSVLKEGQPKQASLGRDLQSALSLMTRADPSQRASLMNLLDVIAEYCHTSSQSKPFTHIVMDLYTEVLGKSSQCLPDNISYTSCSVPASQEHRRSNSYPKPKCLELSSPHRENNISIVKSCSLNSKDLPVRRHPVQRAASRLYRATSFLDSRTKYCTPRTCIGPEFIVRAANPSKIIHISQVKTAHKRRVVVILLNGQKLDISCNGNSTTAKELFEVVVQSEHLEENFMLGLAVLLTGDFVFIPPDTKLWKVAPPCWNSDLKKNSGMPSFTFTMYIRVKLFLPSLRGIRNWSVKHMLYLQLRRCMLEQHVDCSLEQVAVLAGLALQAEFGDHDVQEHGCGDYFLLEHYVPDSLVPCGQESRVKNLLQQQHKQRQGLDPGRAEEAFVSQLQHSASYGAHFHSAVLVNKEGPSLPVWLVVSGEGVSVYSRHSGTHQRVLKEHFVWKNIQKLSFNKNFFFLQSTLGNHTKLKLRMDSRKSYYAFHLASLHHQFFLKLKVELTSLQALSTEFGVLMKQSPERERLFRVEDNHPSKVPILDKWQYGLFTPPKPKAPLQSSNHSLSRVGSWRWHTPLEETQNKENEHPDGLPAVPLLRINREHDGETIHHRKPVDVGKPATVVEAITPRRARVKMGTRAFTSSQQHLFLPLDTSMKICNIMTEKHAKMTPEIAAKKSPVSDAYVINSSIKSVDDNFELIMQESLSESFLQKFNNFSFLNERELKNVRLERDESGSLGIQITQGSDGGVYIQSVIPNGPADQLGTIHKGDQIIAVNGHSLLTKNYQEALQFIQKLDKDIEIILSQSHRWASPHNCDAKLASPDVLCHTTESAASFLKRRLNFSGAEATNETVCELSRRSSKSRVQSSFRGRDSISAVCCMAPAKDEYDALSEDGEETFL